MSENPPVGLMLVPMPLLAGIIGGVIIGIATGSWLWAIVGLVVAALAAAAAGWFFADSLAMRQLGARPLSEQGAGTLRNQLEELCARTGVSEPDLYTVGAGAPAIASFGRSKPSLVVTDGLADDLTVVELEAAVARELGRARSGSTTVDTLAVSFLTVPFGWLGDIAGRMLDFVRGGDHDARADLDGVAITRYPPGMTAALSKMKAPASQKRSVAHLWATGRGAGGIGRFGMEERLEMLQEL